jgi:hypothetical protein
MTHNPAAHSLRMPSPRGTTGAELSFADIVRARLRRPAHLAATVARGAWILTGTAVRVTLLGRHTLP